MGSSELSKLKQQIQQAKQLLSSLDNPVEPIPELINSANALRQNDYLNKINRAKSILIEVYELYIQELEEKLNKKKNISPKTKKIISKRKRSKR